MKRFGLNLRMGLPITGAIVVVLGTMIFLQVRHMGNYARQEAFSKADEMANRYGSRVEALLNDAILTTRTVAQTFEGMKLNWVDDRGLYNGILSQVLKANTNYAAVWSCWEPDALDGKDKTFAGKAGHDETGRFIPLWVRGTNDVQLDKLADYAQPGRGDFYLAVRERKTEVILDPRTLKLGGREVYATTL
ncbi:MAG TPA: cache domain-containing protein, partial [Methylomirabilota bacterium]|nr:cache domain-containing protein [Methylomirabilota bacterium]